MSGNSTRLGVGVAGFRFDYAALVLGVVGLFVVGVVAGTVVSKLANSRRKTAVLLLVAASLMVSSIFHSLGLTYPGTAFMVMAMGAENAVFQRDGEVSIGLTYMTGTLVRLGQQIAGMFYGGPRNTWQPYALHWVSLVAGAVLGAVGHEKLRAHSLWPATIAALLLCYLCRKLRPNLEGIGQVV